MSAHATRNKGRASEKKALHFVSRSSMQNPQWRDESSSNFLDGHENNVSHFNAGFLVSVRPVRAAGSQYNVGVPDETTPPSALY